MANDRRRDERGEVEGAKRVYEPPQLIEYGTVAELTKGDGSNLALEALGVSI